MVTVAQPSTVLPLSPLTKLAYPAMLDLRVSEYVIGIANNFRRDAEKCPIARAAYFALRRTMGPTVQVSVGPSSNGQAALITACIPNTNHGAEYKLEGGFGDIINRWDLGGKMTPFRATAHLIP